MINLHSDEATACRIPARSQPRRRAVGHSRDEDANGWSETGYLLYRSLSAKDSFDIWAMSMTDRKPDPVVRTSAEERDAQFSPDRKWVAYQSNRTGRYESWVSLFRQPAADVKDGSAFQFTFDGGVQTRWGLEGKELFYMAPDGQLIQKRTS